jgi:hypothetical protein
MLVIGLLAAGLLVAGYWLLVTDYWVIKMAFYMIIRL